MNAEQWQARVDEIGFVRATKELVATLIETPTAAELRELRKRLDKLEGKKP